MTKKHYFCTIFNNMHAKNSISVKCVHFPCGDMILGSFDGRLCLCTWAEGKRNTHIDFRLQKMLMAIYREETTDVIDLARHQLNEYFDRKRSEFDLPLMFVGSSFQKNVWDELLKIPYGTTVSYGELAQRIGNPRTVRAVANANATNAISVIVPCHRVIGSDGTMKGYAGGVDRKRFLLDLEQGL